MIVNNYVLRITAVIIVYGDSIEVPTCGRAKISVREVMAMASLDTAEDTVPEVADTESRHTCKRAENYLIQNRNFMCTIRPMFRSGASYVGKNSMVRIS